MMRLLRSELANLKKNLAEATSEEARKQRGPEAEKDAAHWRKRIEQVEAKIEARRRK